MKTSSIKWLLPWLGLAAGVLIFFFLLLVNPFGVPPRAAQVLAIAGLMITWWVAEALPMPVVALTPLVLFPLMGLHTIREVSAGYADPVIFLFMGGFMLGLAIEKWDLHKRIALNIVNLTGTSGDRIVLGFILATGLISMWLSNTATTMMMFPIAASVIHVVTQNHKGNARLNNLALTIMLGIAYASNFGGIATIIGTPPNVAFVAYIRDKYDYNIPFASWALICTPIALLLLFSLYVVMTKILYPSRLAADDSTRQLIRAELKQLGPLSRAEKRVLCIFGGTALLWITRDLVNMNGYFKLDDNMIAIMGAIALFICPSGHPFKSRKILEWSDTTRMAWGILLLFGGGIALAASLEKAGLIEMLGQWIAGFSGSNILLLVFMITLVSLFISEVMSNIAQVIVFSPVIGGIADALHMNPILLGLPMALGASCASMMPMGTPPNAIVFASGHIRLGQMVKTGFVMNLVAVVLITLFCWWLVPLLLGI
ncbi:MAG: DASS family sodium-coupled anion symporter [Candidatus Pseudobacter hemicellulosilyticus]|uniref:DASS family sodium-coupled anion symporter n=1 Tax=Candidatus Pseudobacter hemicellulosilyticus TaxID=3121375 RepID=A0AAJ6BG27_9BACT|nr:MAG: DASS family sodium-coupled anion symporter [Pseudobacter sp.]